jgi:hypothetical protein
MMKVLTLAALCSTVTFAGATEKPPVIVDANKVVMGRSISSGVQLTVGKTKLYVKLTAAIQPNGLPSSFDLDFAPILVYFESTDCTTGSFSIDVPFVGLAWGSTLVKSSGQVLLYPAVGESPTRRS